MSGLYNKNIGKFNINLSKKQNLRTELQTKK